MSSLKDVVTAMSKKTSTLDWDIVVNYSSDELNKLLEASYKNDKGHLKDLSVQVEAYDENDEPFTINYVFQLGVPLLNFDPYATTTPACSLKIPINGGSVKIKKEWTIQPGVYALLLSGIPLATVNDTDRQPKPTDTPFEFPAAPGTTAVVTLDLITAATSLTVELQISDTDKSKHVKQIDGQKGNIETAVRDFFKNPEKVSSIRWDLARVNNSHPSTGSTLLVPKSFRFAVYVVEGTKTNGVLSLFIQTREEQHGRQAGLQAAWTTQWINYKVSPIPTSHTASIIFGNQMIVEMMDKALSAHNMNASVVAGEMLKLKILTHKPFVFPSVDETGVVEKAGFRFNTRSTSSRAEVALDKDPNTLCVTLSQDGDSATMRLDWNFDYSTDWTYHKDGLQRGVGTNQYGSVKVSNNLKATTKTIANDSLPNYVVHLDLSVGKDDWKEPTLTPNEQSGWQVFLGAVNWTPDWFKSHLPEQPGFKVNLVDFDFFMTTNLILPTEKVITFNTSPGIRIPGDIYFVGNVVKK